MVGFIYTKKKKPPKEKCLQNKTEPNETVNKNKNKVKQSKYNKIQNY